MIDDGIYTAVLDRFEDYCAVVLVEDEGDLVGELVVNKEALPEYGQHVDAVFTLGVEDGELVEAMYLDRETDQRKDTAQSRFDRLSERPSSDGDTGSLDSE